MTQYWLVAAFFDRYDMTNIFVNQKSWVLGWTIEDTKNAAVRANGLVRKMKPSDGIAIKSIARRLMTIKALGIVVGDSTHAGPHSDVEQAFYGDGQLIGTRQRIYVDWKVRFQGTERQVPLAGKMSAVHGPFTLENDRGFVNDIFRLV